MSSSYILVNAGMALIDLGIAFVIYRIYRWASTPSAGLADSVTVESLTGSAPARQWEPASSVR